MNVEQDRLYRRRILEEVRPLGSRGTIYYGHVPPTRDRQPSEGCPRAALRASRGDRNNNPYIAPPLLAISPQSPLPCGRGRLSKAFLGRGLERCRHTDIYNNNISLLNV